MAVAKPQRRWRAVLTGASGGIGAAIAAELAPHCEALILVGRQRAALDALAGSLTGLAVYVVCGDLRLVRMQFGCRTQPAWRVAAGQRRARPAWAPPAYRG